MKLMMEKTTLTTIPMLPNQKKVTMTLKEECGEMASEVEETPETPLSNASTSSAWRVYWKATDDFRPLPPAPHCVEMPAWGNYNGRTHMIISQIYIHNSILSRIYFCTNQIYHQYL